MRILLKRIVQFRHGEAPIAWLMFAYSFLAMTSYNVLKPITKSKFIVTSAPTTCRTSNSSPVRIIGVLMELHSWAIAGCRAGRSFPSPSARCWR